MRAQEIAVVAGTVAAPLLIGFTLWGHAAAGPADVTVKLFQFQPGRLEVTRGTAVTWTNQDDIRHTVTSGTPQKRDTTFNAELAAKGAIARVTFAEAGVFPYFCDRHQSMRGEIHVQ